MALLAGLVAIPGLLAAQGGELRVQRVPSAAIAGNLLGESSNIEVAVYTPPGYWEGNRRYPVLYLLHGIAGTYRDWTEGGYQGLRLPTELDSLIGVGAVPPMIVVMPTAMNRYLGSYYTNSPVTGRWGDFVAQELVAWVDGSHRTIAHPGGRGVAGHSMGGFGALTLAMDYPGVFSVVYALSPCCLMLTDDLDASNPAWRRVLSFQSPADVNEAVGLGELYPVAMIGISSVANPDRGRPPFYTDLPFRLDDRGSVIKSKPAHDTFLSFFPVNRVSSAPAALRGLRALTLDVGRADEFSHIVPGTIAFAKRLEELDIPHHVELYEGDHRNRLRKRVVEIVLPYFGAHLDQAGR